MSGPPPLSRDELLDLRVDLGTALGELCTIERDSSQEAPADEYGQAPAPAWVAHLADVPCAYWQSVGSTDVAEGREVVVEQRTIAVPSGTDVRESDRVVNVIGHDGAVREAGPLRIDAVTERASHVELAVTEVAW